MCDFFSFCFLELVLKPTDETCKKSESRESKPLSIVRSQSCCTTADGPQRNAIVSQFRRFSSTLHELIALPPSPAQTSDCFDVSDVVLRLCKQSAPLPFDQVYANDAELRHCRKIGEGVYSEVFMNKCADTGHPKVLKIVPIEGKFCVNGEPQKKFHEILSEIVIATELSNLRNGRGQFMTDGFVELLQVRCVQGRYPEQLIELWELYQENCGTENDHPGIFDEDQLFIVFELANVGQDLEAFQLQNALQAYSAFLQVSLTKIEFFFCFFVLIICCRFLRLVGVFLEHITKTNHD